MSPLSQPPMINLPNAPCMTTCCLAQDVSNRFVCVRQGSTHWRTLGYASPLLHRALDRYLRSWSAAKQWRRLSAQKLFALVAPDMPKASHGLPYPV